MMRSSFIVVWAILLSAALILGSCGGDAPNSKTEKQHREAQRKINTRISQLHDNLLTLRHAINRMGDQAKEKFGKMSDQMDQEITKVRGRADYLKNHAGEQWDQVQVELNKTLDGLDKKFDQMKSDVLGSSPPEAPVAGQTPAPTPSHAPPPSPTASPRPSPSPPPPRSPIPSPSPRPSPSVVQPTPAPVSS